MTTNVKVLADFLQQMDWEGGIEGIINHGYHEVGDDKLAILLANAKATLDAVNIRINELTNQYGEELYTDEG